ncbi:MAG TPA: glycosyltransferase [Stellaceae bacterium]|jgi:glycosyltransferase involved in cell wall biosynthesis|nr:glycosyltransferase [Stellaceae bacterium]
MMTLITATLNAAKYIERACESVWSGPSRTLQHIVVDGGSKDKTLGICGRFPSIETVVVPGCSIYEAWNIGLSRARGDWVMFLNADDELAETAVETVAASFASRPEVEIVAGCALLMERDSPDASRRLLVAAPSGRLDVEQLALGVPAINAMAFRRSVFERYGDFETIYRVAGDRAFLLRLATRSPPIVIAPTETILYRYYSHPGSLTLKPSLEQRLRIAGDHISLADRLLADRPPRSVARLLHYWRRREAAVATWRCAAAGRPVAALQFAGRFFAGACRR